MYLWVLLVCLFIPLATSACAFPPSVINSHTTYLSEIYKTLVNQLPVTILGYTVPLGFLGGSCDAPSPCTARPDTLTTCDILPDELQAFSPISDLFGKANSIVPFKTCLCNFYNCYSTCSTLKSTCDANFRDCINAEDFCDSSNIEQVSSLPFFSTTSSDIQEKCREILKYVKSTTLLALSSPLSCALYKKLHTGCTGCSAIPPTPGLDISVIIDRLITNHFNTLTNNFNLNQNVAVSPTGPFNVLNFDCDANNLQLRFDISYPIKFDVADYFPASFLLSVSRTQLENLLSSNIHLKVWIQLNTSPSLTIHNLEVTLDGISSSNVNIPVTFKAQNFNPAVSLNLSPISAVIAFTPPTMQLAHLDSILTASSSIYSANFQITPPSLDFSINLNTALLSPVLRIRDSNIFDSNPPNFEVDVGLSGIKDHLMPLFDCLNNFDLALSQLRILRSIDIPGLKLDSYLDTFNNEIRNLLQPADTARNYFQNTPNPTLSGLVNVFRTASSKKRFLIASFKGLTITAGKNADEASINFDFSYESSGNLIDLGITWEKSFKPVFSKFTEISKFLSSSNLPMQSTAFGDVSINIKYEIKVKASITLGIPISGSIDPNDAFIRMDALKATVSLIADPINLKFNATPVLLGVTDGSAHVLAGIVSDDGTDTSTEACAPISLDSTYTNKVTIKLLRAKAASGLLSLKPMISSLRLKPIGSLDVSLPFSLTNTDGPKFGTINPVFTIKDSCLFDGQKPKINVDIDINSIKSTVQNLFDTFGNSVTSSLSVSAPSSSSFQMFSPFSFPNFATSLANKFNFGNLLDDYIDIVLNAKGYPWTGTSISRIGHPYNGVILRILKKLFPDDFSIFAANGLGTNGETFDALNYVNFIQIAFGKLKLPSKFLGNLQAGANFDPEFGLTFDKFSFGEVVDDFPSLTPKFTALKLKNPFGNNDPFTRFPTFNYVFPSSTPSGSLGVDNKFKSTTRKVQEGFNKNKEQLIDLISNGKINFGKLPSLPAEETSLTQLTEVFGKVPTLQGFAEYIKSYLHADLSKSSDHQISVDFDTTTKKTYFIFFY